MTEHYNPTAKNANHDRRILDALTLPVQGNPRPNAEYNTTMTNRRLLLSTLAIGGISAMFDASPSSAQTTNTAPSAPPIPATPTLPGASATDPDLIPGFHHSPWFHEQTREQWIEPGVRVLLNAPTALDPSKRTRLIIYATPNGNTAEQTLGSAAVEGGDWHYDIQHIGAQTRRLREVTPTENIILAVVQPDTLSWPTWRKSTVDNAIRIRDLVEVLRSELQLQPSPGLRINLVAHSGGGSFLFGYINGSAAIPDYIDRIAFLDANYSYSDDDKHGDKLIAWLKSDPGKHLDVIAYDDRNIELNGKKVVGPDGGTFRASDRMRSRLAKEFPLTESKSGDFVSHSGLGGQVTFHVDTNPQNKILHTTLVGVMNGFLEAMTTGSAASAPWGTFGGPRAYTPWIQPAAGIPARPVDAIGGAPFMASIASLLPAAREQAIGDEICRGNIPDFLRKFKTITVTGNDPAGKPHSATYDVMPDYLCVGSDADFVRVPMTPMTAQRIADAFGCSLPDRKLVNDIYAQAEIKLEPHPMTEAREAVATFVEYNGIIETQRAGKTLGLLVAGNKKDIVITNRLTEKPHRVAIYGWHKLDGLPIQPLVIVHKDTYVDYSHGVRLVKRAITIDGKTQDLHAALHSADLWPLLSDEGAISSPSY